MSDADQQQAGTAEVDLYQTQEYLDAMEDVHTRFLLNLPDSELQTADRLFFQMEQAWWYYEDWICDPDPDCPLPRFANFRPFAQRLFAYSPLLPDKPANKFNTMWNQFAKYKQKIGNYGCIMLNEACTQVILTRVWNSTTYTFPAGKINQHEDGASAAARETYEETGFDPSCTLGLTATWKASGESDKITWPSFPSQREQDALVHQEDNGKRRTAYIVVGVPQDFPFEPVARKEVSAVEWHNIDKIPRPSYGVMPFMGPLKRWIKKYQKKQGGSGSKNDRSKSKSPKPTSRPRGKKSAERGGGRKTPTKSRERGRRQPTPKREKVDSNDPLVASGLVQKGELSGWSEEDMFKANERLLGRKVEYDGNPHVFVEEGLSTDPHQFRMVGGGFLNADHGGIESLAPPPPESKLQPLFRPQTGSSAEASGSAADNELKPFFSQEGATPWGQVVDEAKDASPRSFGKAAEKPLVVSEHTETSGGDDPVHIMDKEEEEEEEEEDDDLGLFLTDAQITAKSQNEKTSAATTSEDDMDQMQKQWKTQYERDMKFVRQWVANLPKPTPTKHFGEWKLDADALLAGTPLATTDASGGKTPKKATRRTQRKNALVEALGSTMTPAGERRSRRLAQKEGVEQ